MNLVNQLYTTNKKTNQMLILFALYCLTLSLFRAKLTHSIYLFFLIWNLFLAAIPYVITSYLKLKNNCETSKLKTLVLIFTWLLFLPNSFYIITDLVHIVRTDGTLFWMDLVLVSSYSFLGFVVGLKSIYQFEMILKISKFKPKTPFIIPIICILCGIGIYMGRILRFNSWDIINHPIRLIVSTLNKLLVVDNLQFSLLFGTFIYFIYLLKKSNYENL